MEVGRVNGGILPESVSPFFTEGNGLWDAHPLQVPWDRTHSQGRCRLRQGWSVWEQQQTSVQTLTVGTFLRLFLVRKGEGWAELLWN